jgi:hypothetical protein
MNPKLTKQLKPHLQNQEKIVSSVKGTYEIKIMNKDSIRNGNLIATDKRIIFFAKKLFGYDLESFPFKNISSIEKSKGMLGHSITFFASGNKCTMKWIKSGEISNFTDYVNTKIGVSNNETEKTLESIPDLIKKLHKLKDEGILSEEEFNTKKTELLKKM